jgi:hypothetical protein
MSTNFQKLDGSIQALVPQDLRASLLFLHAISESLYNQDVAAILPVIIERIWTLRKPKGQQMWCGDAPERWERLELSS